MNFIEKSVKKFSDMSPVAKASFALVFAKFFQKGLTLISGPLFTRIMTTDEYGTLSTFTSWQNIVYIIITLNISSGIFNNGMQEFKKDRSSYIKSCIAIANIFTISALLIYLIFYNFFTSLFELEPILMLIILLYCFFTPAYNFWMGQQRYEFKYKATTIVTILLALLSTSVAILLVLLVDEGNKAILKIFGAESIAIFIAMIIYIKFLSKKEGRIKLKYFKYILKFGLPLIPHYISLYVLASSDRLMISKLVDLSSAGIYNVAYTVASILLIFWNSIDASYAPWIYQKLEAKNFSDIRKRGNQILLFFALASVMANLFAPEIMKILAPSQYFTGTYVIPAISAGVYFTAVYSLYMRIELFAKKTKVIMIGTVLSAALNLILNYVYIPQFGFYAAGYTTLICYFILAIFHWINVKRLGFEKCYSTKNIILISLCVIFSAIIMPLIYNFTILRYAIISIMFIVIIVKRKNLIYIFKKKK